VALLVALADSCLDEDCDVWDCGTCGAPCCILSLTFPTLSADALSVKLMEVINSPSFDRYKYHDVHCVGSPIPTTSWSWDPTEDASAPLALISPAEPKAKASCVALLHAVTGSNFLGIQFHDQVNFVITDDENITTMKAASISSGAGPPARCDWGQNWHNIKSVLTALEVPLEEMERTGCSVSRPVGSHMPHSWHPHWTNADGTSVGSDFPNATQPFSSSFVVGGRGELLHAWEGSSARAKGAMVLTRGHDPLESKMPLYSSLGTAMLFGVIVACGALLARRGQSWALL